VSKITALFLVAFATNAYAFRGRPVSGLRFERHVGVSIDRVASDYTDFVLLTGNEYTVGGVFTQKIAGGVPVGPHRQLGSGKPEELAWMGTEYLAAWTEGKALRTATVSREGTPLSVVADPVITGDRTFLGVNGTRVLAFAYTGNTLKVQSLDTQGRPTGVIQTYTTPAVLSSVAAGRAANGAIGVAFSGFSGTWLMLFRADGTTITSAPIVLDGPYDGGTTHRHSNTAAIATNGRNTAVVFGSELYEGNPELRTAIVGVDGSLKAVRVTHTMAVAGGAITPVSLVWDGAQFLALLNVSSGDGEADPALLRIGGDGTRIDDFAWITQEHGRQFATRLGWNGRDLLAPLYDSTKWPEYDAFCIPIDAATLKPGARARLARTLTRQEMLTIEAGPDRYLAAWFETSDATTTVRASRIDGAGNYLDGEGIILASYRAFPRRFPYTIAIDGSGPQWLVVWTGLNQVQARAVSRNGIAGAPFAIGEGDEAAVRWDGAQYVVLHSNVSLFRTNVSASGVAGETVTLAEYEEYGAFLEKWVSYEQPALVKLGTRLLAVYNRIDGVCAIGFPFCGEDRTITGLFLGDPGAAPFPILPNEYASQFAIVASDSRALLAWAGSSFGGLFIDANGTVGAPFLLGPNGSQPALAFDGTGFAGAWLLQGGKLKTARIEAGGTLSDPHEVEVSADRPVLAANATRPVLAGFTGRFVPYDDVPRAVLAFPHDLSADALSTQPSIVCATRNEDDTITVRWQHAGDALGIAIELELSDGTFREIGVAAADATMATVSTAGLAGSAVRVRAWNEAGVSAPSAVASSLPAPEAVLPPSMNACAGVELVLTATLHGAPPFRVRWSDGVEQTGVNAHTV
jgi:hypothetical protein